TAGNWAGGLKGVDVVDAEYGLGVGHVEHAGVELDLEVLGQRVGVAGAEVPLVVGLDLTTGAARQHVDQEAVAVVEVRGVRADVDRQPGLEAEGGAEGQATGLLEIEAVEAVALGPVGDVVGQRTVAVTDQLGGVELGAGGDVDRAVDRVDEA